MILLSKENFSVDLLEKQHHSPAAPKDTFYGNFKVCLALDGEAVWEIEDRTYVIRPGDIVFLSCGQARRFTFFGENGFRLCVFNFDRDVFTNLQHFAFFLECIKRQNSVICSSPLTPLLMEIYTEMAAGHPLRFELASAKFTEFFIKLENELGYTYQAYAKADREMLDILQYIDANITSDIRLHTLAAKTGLTESAFSRRFSQFNGISFKKYVVAKRISRAVMLLQTTNLSIADIALDCGFESISGFYDAFKKRTGTTPNNISKFDI
jgi:AraC-like DNA-binding protein